MSNQEANCTCNCAVHEQDKKALLAKVIESYRDKEGSLIMVLHAAQDLYGYLPEDVLKYIADELGLSYSYVSGVVSFYSFFSTVERGKHTIRVCMGTACYVRGGKLVVEALEEKLGVPVGGTTDDKKFTFEIARCIGAFGLAPTIMVDDTVYKYVTPKNVDDILAEY